LVYAILSVATCSFLIEFLGQVTLFCYSFSDIQDYSFRGDDPSEEGKLFDHQPLKLNKDDYERVQRIPVKKVSKA
jgi:hypothetical protein